MIQEVLVYAVVVFATIFLVRKFFFKPKSNKSDCDTDCKC